MNGAPFGKIARAGAAGAQEIEDGTKDIVQIHPAGCCTLVGAFQQGKSGGGLWANFRHLPLLSQKFAVQAECQQFLDRTRLAT